MEQLPLLKDVYTITILRSRAGVTANGTAGLVFDTKEMGTIAFAVPLQVIAPLRGSLDEIERFLTRGKTN